MTVRTNAHRAADAETVLRIHALKLDDDPTADIIDLVTNLLHFANNQGIDTNEIINAAKMHVQAEIEGEL